jgi:hypothetical protein
MSRRAADQGAFDGKDGRLGALDGTALRGLLEKHCVVRGNLKLPSASALQPLSDRIELYRNLIPLRNRLLREGDVPRRKARDAIHALRQALPPIRQELSSWAARIIELKLEQMESCSKIIEELKHVDELMAALDKITPNSGVFPISDGLPAIDSWHEYATELADLFRDAVSTSNPRAARLGNSNDGPVARFLSVVIPVISSEYPSIEALAQSLKRAARGDTSVAVRPGDIH